MTNQQQNHRDLLDYIGDLTSELARLAKAARCDSLSHLLEMAVEEAEHLSESSDGEELRDALN
jgi:hypothetical protein